MGSRSRNSSFIRKGAAHSPPFPSAIVRQGPHGTFLVSSGFSDLDKILGGGIPIGSLVMVMEHLDAPHHMLLLRYFMAQGLAHGQPLLFASSLSHSDAFLGTLPRLMKRKEGQPDDSSTRSSQFESQCREGLRIAWQYRKYFDGHSLEDRTDRQPALMSQTQGTREEYCSTFDMRKLVERSSLSAGNLELLTLHPGTTITQLREKCESFCSKLSRSAEGMPQICRIALQSLCAPQGVLFDKDWEMLAFLHFLKGLLRTSNAVGLLTFPAPLLTPSFSIRWQHMADVLLSVEAIPDDNKDMAALLTDYNDTVCFLRISKVPCINTQLPAVPEAAVYALKFLRRKTLVLEGLNQAPVDATGEEQRNKSVTSLHCSGPVNASSPLDF